MYQTMNNCTCSSTHLRKFISALVLNFGLIGPESLMMKQTFDHFNSKPTISNICPHLSTYSSSASLSTLQGNLKNLQQICNFYTLTINEVLYMCNERK